MHITPESNNYEQEAVRVLQGFAVGSGIGTWSGFGGGGGGYGWSDRPTDSICGRTTPVAHSLIGKQPHMSALAARIGSAREVSSTTCHDAAVWHLRCMPN
jgi:hypothetical protein